MKTPREIAESVILVQTTAAWSDGGLDRVRWGVFLRHGDKFTPFAWPDDEEGAKRTADEAIEALVEILKLARPPHPPPSTSSPSPPPEAARGEKLWGWQAIAAHLGVPEATARSWAQLIDDPLPVRLWCGAARYAWSRYLDDWLERRVGRGEALHGWEAICARLEGCDEDTARRWARRKVDRLPVFGLPGKPRAFASAVRDWVHRQDKPVHVG